MINSLSTVCTKLSKSGKIIMTDSFLFALSLDLYHDTKDDKVGWGCPLGGIFSSLKSFKIDSSCKILTVNIEKILQRLPQYMPTESLKH